jgi:hypothetical protein
MDDFFYDYVHQPSFEKFLILREIVLHNEDFDPYSADLAEMVKAYKADEFIKVAEIYKSSFRKRLSNPS